MVQGIYHINFPKSSNMLFPNPPPNLVGVAFVVLQDVFVVDSASHMLRLGRREGFGRRF